MLRLLLLLDGEATDMDEFELDILGLSWAHVTIFLIGVDGTLASPTPLPNTPSTPTHLPYTC